MVVGAACGSSDQSYSAGSGGSGYGGQATGRGSGTDVVSRQRYGGDHGGGVATGDTEHGAAFARWVLDQDPRRQYITDAVVRGNTHLGVKVQPNITRGDLNRLLESLAQGMAREFPGQEIQVTAFYQSGDRLAEAHFDPRSRQVYVEMAS